MKPAAGKYASPTLRGSTLRRSRSTLLRGWVFLLALGMAGSVMAQGKGGKRNCSDPSMVNGMSKAEEINSKLECRTDNVNMELDTLVDQAASSGMFSSSAVKSLENARDHAHRARERTKNAGGFKGLGRKQKSDCYFQEAQGVDGDEDGICTTRGGMKETCAEVIGDGIGDDDGLCEKTGNQKEVCVEICDSTLNDQDDDNFDDGAAHDVEVGLTDLETALADTNNTFSQVVQAFHQKNGARFTAASTDACFEVPPWSTLVTAALVDAKTVAEYAFDVCSTVCGNDVAGFNCEAGCVGPATAKYILAALVNLSDQLEEDLNRAGYEVQYSCQGQTSAAVAAVDVKATSTEAKVDSLNATANSTEAMVVELQGKVDALQARIEEIMELLNTPQGRRPDFPGK